MWGKIIRIMGLIFLIGFSSASLLIFQFQRAIQTSGQSATWINFSSYPVVLENRFYDFRVNLILDENYKDPDLILASIDDPSLNAIGRWPWSRAQWIPIINKLKHYGAKVVAFDVIFSEPEKSCGGPSPDIAFAQTINEFQAEGDRHIILSYSLNSNNSYDDAESFKEMPPNLYNFILDTRQNAEEGIILKRVASTTFPVDNILSAEPGLAHIGADEDLDGVFRKYPLVANVETLFLPSFSLLAYQYFTGDKPVLSIDREDYKIKVKTGEGELNFKGEMKVRWSGGNRSFTEIGLVEILNASESDEEMHKIFNNKLVFIGSTAFAAHDLRHTPVDSKLPGVFVHMNATRMLIDGKFFKPKTDSLFISWGFLLAGTIAMLIISLLGNALLDVGFLIAFCLGVFFVDIIYFLPKGYEITLFFILFSVIATYSWNTLLNFYFASKDKKFLKSAFGSYISPELIDVMYKSGEPPKLGGEVGVLTAYFTDIQSFSTFSEKLSAAKLVELLNEYLTAMTEILLDEQGTLDKYEGDAIIAFFGAPVPLSDHARRSCLVALKMQNSLVELRKKWTQEGDKWPTIVHDMRMRIGINSGEILTGNMGSKNRMNYTMMGDSVNLAARLESSAKQYGIFTHVSQTTKELAGDHFEFRELDTVRVVGKSEPITTYDLLGIKNEISPDLIELKNMFHQGLDAYKNRKWEEAISYFEKSLVYEHKRYPLLEGKINPSLVYIERAKEFLKNPPPDDWDGVYTMTSK